MPWLQHILHPRVYRVKWVYRVPRDGNNYHVITGFVMVIDQIVQCKYFNNVDTAYNHLSQDENLDPPLNHLTLHFIQTEVASELHQFF